jgi:hypothetical protein
MYIRESDVGRGRVDSIKIGEPDRQGAVLVSFYRQNGGVSEKQGRIQDNRLLIDGETEYFEIVNATTFTRDGIRWVKITRNGLSIFGRR